MRAKSVLVLFILLLLFSCATGGHVLTEAEKTFLLAANNNDYTAVLEYIRGGGNVNVDRNGISALMTAAGQGYTEMVILLLENGADPDQIDVSGSTAMMYAAQTGRLAAVKALVQAGADPSLEGSGGWTALSEAERAGHERVIFFLKSIGAGEGDFRAARWTMSPAELKTAEDGVLVEETEQSLVYESHYGSIPSLIRYNFLGGRLFSIELSNISPLSSLAAADALRQFALDNNSRYGVGSGEVFWYIHDGNRLIEALDQLPVNVYADFGFWEKGHVQAVLHCLPASDGFYLRFRLLSRLPELYKDGENG